MEQFLDSGALEKFIKRDWEVTDTNTRGIVDSIGNGCGGTNDTNLANAFRAHWVDMGIVFVNP